MSETHAGHSEKSDPATGERDEVFVHRLEAFSDIVMGLAITELGVSLVIPAHAQSLLNNRVWIGSFVWTFSVICMSWLNHYRLFRYAFFPSAVNVIVNFALLAIIVLLAYMSQVYNHAVTETDQAMAMTMYVILLAANLFASAFLSTNGARIRRALIPSAAYERAAGVGARLTVAASIMLVAAIVVQYLPIDYRAETIGTSIGVAFICGNLVARRVRRTT